MRTVSPLFIALAVLVTTGCPPSNSTRIAIYVRACVVQGTKWYQVPNPMYPAPARTNAVMQIVQDASAIWEKGADVAFIPLLNGNGEIPEIAVPGAGAQGQIRQDQSGGFSDQSSSASNLCAEAWQNQTPDGSVPGIPIVFVGKILNEQGDLSSGQTGYETPNLINYVRNSGKDLCQLPYNILSTDVVGRIAFVSTDTGSAPQYIATQELATRTAHELGHALLLAHGDGLDNDQNGVWDERCDNPEFLAFDTAATATTDSIMNPMPSTEMTITLLQRALARSAAKFVPGVIGGPFP